MKIKILLLAIWIIVGAGAAVAQTNEFTYQGRLTDGSMPANASYDFIFTLCATASDCFNSNRLSVRTRLGVPVSSGSFTVTLDFPATDFNGADRWLETRVRPAGSSTYTELAPRQRITSSPYAIRSLNATNSTQLGGVAANEFVQTDDSRLTDARSPLSGSNNYIQNNSSAGAQPVNFNISGYGLIGGNALVGGNLTVNGNTTASFYNAALNYRIGGQRVVGVVAPNNTYVGIGTGLSSAGADNSFFGFNAGGANGLGNDNSFFGSDAGGINNDGNQNSFFGSDTGDSNTSGSGNSFFGRNSGTANTTGGNNTFIGLNAGASNITGGGNTAIGVNANFGSSNLVNATAIGANAVVTRNNTIQIGAVQFNPNVGTTTRVGGLEIGFAEAPLANTTRDLCLTDADSDGYSRALVCVSSQRFKNNIQTFTSGLDIVRRLRPVTFDWLGGGKRDVGFVAEEVAEVAPLFAIYNQNGEVQSVKYKQITTVLVNAVNEQQTQIADQQKQIQQQRLLIDALLKLVCSQNPQAEVCKGIQK